MHGAPHRQHGIVQPLKARQVADEGWQLPSELIVRHTPAYHNGKGVRIVQARLPGTHSTNAGLLLVSINHMMRRTKYRRGAATDRAVSTNAHAWGPTQAARIVQDQKVGQVADGGWQLPGELIGIQMPANHVCKGVRIGQTWLPNAKRNTRHEH